MQRFARVSIQGCDRQLEVTRRLPLSSTAVASTFVKDLANDALARVGTRAALATAINVSKQHLGRVLAGKAGLGPLALVRAAKVTERNVLDVLREGGERELADELEALVGDKFTVSQRAFLEEWDKLPPNVRRHLREVVKAWAGAAPVSAPKRPHKRQR